MTYYMVGRLGDLGTSPSPMALLHLALALLLGPLLLVKILIARYYKHYYGSLLALGLALFVGSFTLVGIMAGPALARHAAMRTVSLAALHQPPTVLDLTAAAATMEKRCSKCHALDRVTGAR